MKRVAMILGGDGHSLFKYKNDIENSDLIIACDGGGDYLNNIGVIPHILIGDMDSISVKTLNYFIEKEVKVIRFPKDKDFTDAYLSFQYACRVFEKSTIKVYAYSGGREDHFLAILIDAERFAGVERNIEFIGDGNNIYSIAGDLTIQGHIGDIVSVFSLTGAYISQCKGLMYDISDTSVSCSMTKGISNELTKKNAYISILKGKLTIFHYFKLKQEDI